MTKNIRTSLNWTRVLFTVLATLALGSGNLARAQDPQADVDPPGRAARISDIAGQVWLYTPDSGDWIAADPNRPLTTGDRIATDPGARAEVQLGSTTLRLDASSELEVVQLDDDHFALELHDGSVIAQVRDPSDANQFEMNTEEGRFVVERPGNFRFDRFVVGNGTGGNMTRSDATVYSGQARYEGSNSALPIQVGQRAEFWIDASGVAQYTMLQPASDAFTAWSNSRDRPAVAGPTQRYVSPEMTGAADLDQYGRWDQDPDYGAVWVPTAVASDWAPYSHGHWAFVRPWGWTWIDDAPWGFAPFHYGRWVYARNNWCWTPGARAARPVYAPALVAWVGGSRGGVSVNVNIGGGPAVGWFPLAPREVYVPSYRTSPRYIRNVNITNVTNVTVINNVIANPNGPREFGNQRAPRAVTIVPENVMRDRRPGAPAAAQFRQSPGGREFVANQPGGRVAVSVAAPVAAPVLPSRGADSRNVRPPPGMPDRPVSVGRPGVQSPRDRGEPGRVANQGDPSRANNGRVESGRVEPGRVEPGRQEAGRAEPGRAEPGRPEAGRVDPRDRGDRGVPPPPGRAQTGVAPGQQPQVQPARDFPRQQLQPLTAPTQGQVGQPGNGASPPGRPQQPQPAVAQPQSPQPQAPQGQRPQPQPPVAQPQGQPQGQPQAQPQPNMRAMPVHPDERRADDRRIEDRRQEVQQRSPQNRPEGNGQEGRQQGQQQRQPQARPQEQQPRFERPQAAPAQAPAPRPVEAAPRPAPAPAPAPVARPAEVRPPEARPQPRAEEKAEPKRGEPGQQR